MKYIVLAMLVLAGCASPNSGDDATVKAGSGEILNPGGKPRNEQEAATAAAMQEQGNAMNQSRGAAAKAMADAKARSGGQ